jgi:UDP-N-acetyl-D-glucosamine dehydrogenase
MHEDNRAIIRAMPLDLQRINDRTCTIGLIGLGYVGLPLGLVFSEAGLRVLGFDIDAAKVAQLSVGASYIRHIGPERVAAAVASGRFSATTDFSRAAACDALIICVPTPLDSHLQPDLRFIVDTCEAIAPHVRPGTLVVLESTTWPGTTVEVVQPILERDGRLKVGINLFLAFSPEREDPGNAKFSTKTIPKLVGGADGPSRDLAVALYGSAIDTVVPVSSTQVAEMAKLFENIFRGVNIALVNEMKVVLDRMGIDVWEVIRAASTKPFGFMPFYPGPGLGGHCIPLDPFYFSWKAKEFGINTRFIELAGEINRSMPAYVVGKVQDCLNTAGKALKGSRVLVLGIAYKANIDDMRESPSLELIHLLEAKGAIVSYHDPHVPVIPPTREHAAFTGRRSEPLGSAFDCFLLATAHRDYTAETVLGHGVPVVDTRNVLPRGPLVFPA